MNESRRRGTREQRVAQAKARIAEEYRVEYERELTRPKSDPVAMPPTKVGLLLAAALIGTAHLPTKK